MSTSLEEFAAYTRGRIERLRNTVVGARIEDVRLYHEYDAGVDEYNAGVEFFIRATDGTLLRIDFSVQELDNETRGSVNVDDMPDVPMTADKGCIWFVTDAASDEEAIRRYYDELKAGGRWSGVDAGAVG